MSLFTIIYNFFYQYIFNANGMTGDANLILDVPLVQNTELGEAISARMWLSEISTYIILGWLVICCFLFVRWIFRLFAGLIKG